MHCPFQISENLFDCAHFGAYHFARRLVPSLHVVNAEGHMQEEHREPAPFTVLVVDDDEEMRALIRDVFKRAGLRVVEESDGKRAIATLERQQVDAVILDKEMPGISGLDLLSFIRAKYASTPVIVMTAFGGPSVEEESMRRGAHGYMEKPFKVGELLHMVGMLIGNRLSVGSPFDLK